MRSRPPQHLIDLINVSTLAVVAGALVTLTDGNLSPPHPALFLSPSPSLSSGRPSFPVVVLVFAPIAVVVTTVVAVFVIVIVSVESWI